MTFRDSHNRLPGRNRNHSDNPLDLGITVICPACEAEKAIELVNSTKELLVFEFCIGCLFDILFQPMRGSKAS